MTPTGAAVRMPDQFRPSRDTPMAATPTCCCCCCCLSTVITASIVLPMRVELLARQAPSVAPARVTTSKTVAVAAPLGSFALSLLVVWRWGEPAAFTAVLLVATMASLAVVFAPFGSPLRSLKVTAVLAAAFVAEFTVGLVGILATAGIGYLAVAVFGAVVVVNFHRRQLAGTRPAFQAVDAPAPPPVPRPPSNGDPS
ncbi:MAG TPA: hypothetical protein VM938_09450 [Acidimicrobiales bacterium]|nr:hypothetical protein [Acidimicrobiales bacterium]